MDAISTVCLGGWQVGAGADLVDVVRRTRWHPDRERW